MPLGKLKDRIVDFITGTHHYEGEWRTVYVLNRFPSDDPEVEIRHKKFADNVIKTSKYTLWNFIPKNLFEQFRRIANFYFLCMGIIQLLPVIDSPVSPVTSILPLVFVITVTAIKQAYEDWIRHKADNEVNNRPTQVVRHNKFEDVASKDILVGDIVRVKDNEEFPCDLVVLSSDDPEGTCHITTANLDGETNLKLRSSLSNTASLQSAADLARISARVECQHPHADLYSFSGRIVFTDPGAEEVTKALGPQNLLLRGARLKNTEYINGIAVYTGKETKMALNQKEAPHKFSTVEKTMNSFLIVFLVVLLLEGILCASLKYWKHTTTLSPGTAEIVDRSAAQGFIVDLFVFIVLYNYVIPISLYVTVELQKFIGAMFFAWDYKMYNPDTDEPAVPNTSDLNEELGQVEYVFSDKTGTLTENDMQFRECSVDGTKYIEIDKQLYPDGQHADNDSSLSVSNVQAEVVDFYLALALCHTVQASPETNPDAEYPYHYQASSPDEKALVEAAARFGITFQGKVGDDLELKVGNQVKRYTLLHVLEFDSTRKRMSVIVNTPDGKILMVTKGADTAVLSRVKSGPHDVTLDAVNYYATKGLRTLVVGQRIFAADEFAAIDKELILANQAINDREEQLAKVFDKVERDFQLLGATAVEDRLQDGVPQTIVALREAGMKVWILTGDKQETAVNISHSCKHFLDDMDIMFISQKKSETECFDELEQCKRRIMSKEDRKDYRSNGVVIDGASLAHVFKGHQELLMEVCRHCVAVLCCRMSPLQKAQIVHLVKNSGSEKPVTLAIGDGANDCGMIQEAHVGIGVMGKEGRQAVMTSDYAISRFRFLLRALLVHGHWYYVRSAVLVNYFFYKNVCFITPQFFYAFFNAFSGQPLYHGFFLTTYNICFTSLPILTYGIFEQHIPDSVLYTRPYLFKDISGNARLSWKEFYIWILFGYWHALVFFFGAYFLFQGDPAIGADMVQFGNWSFGTFVFTLVVIVANLKLALETNYWTGLSHFFTWGSIVAFFVFAIVFNSSLWESFQMTFSNELIFDHYWIFFELLSQGTIWLAIFGLVALALLPDVIYMLVKRHFFPSETQKAQLLPFTNLYLHSCKERYERRRLSGDFNAVWPVDS